MSDLGQKSAVHLWNAYCERKMQCEDLQEQLTTLRQQNAELVEALDIALGVAIASCDDDRLKKVCDKLRPFEQLLQKIKGKK